MIEQFRNPEIKKMAPEDRAILAIAGVQGAWNAHSRNILTSSSGFSEDLEMGDESFVEKALIKIAAGALNALLGDESVAHMILGRPVMLSKEYRGMLILSDLISPNDKENAWQLKRTAVLLQGIKDGQNFENIVSSLEKRSGAFFNILGKEVAGETEKSRREMVGGLVDLYGGGESDLSQREQVLKIKLLADLTRKGKSMGVEALSRMADDINKCAVSPQDQVLKESCLCAKDIFREMIKSGISDFEFLLTRVNQ